MIIDSIWRLFPYMLLSMGVWLAVVGLVMYIRSVDGALTLWFWLRVIASAMICSASCIWIHKRHEST